MIRHYISFSRREQAQTKAQERDGLERKGRTTMGNLRPSHSGTYMHGDNLPATRTAWHSCERSTP